MFDLHCRNADRPDGTSHDISQGDGRGHKGSFVKHDRRIEDDVSDGCLPSPSGIL
jgi:hypothetical protein